MGKGLAPARQLEEPEVQWLTERRRGIGGTDAAAILGASKWASPIDIWQRKRGEAPEVEETEAMWFGKALEDIVARRFAETTGLKLYNPALNPPEKRIVVHPQHPELIASPDRLMPAQREGLEIKTGNVFTAHEWGHEGTDEIPLPYLIQVLHYLGVTGFKRWHVAVLLGGQDFRRYVVYPAPDVIAGMEAKLVAWWQRHIVAGERPPLDGTDSSAEFLARRYPVNTQPRITAPEEANAWADEYRHQHAIAQAADGAAERAKNEIKELVGAHAGFKGPDWQCSWTTARGRTTVDWETIARTLAEEFVLEPTFERLIADHTQHAEDVRRFRFTNQRR